MITTIKVADSISILRLINKLSRMAAFKQENAMLFCYISAENWIEFIQSLQQKFAHKLMLMEEHLEWE